jgi:hypothetical protein
MEKKIYDTRVIPYVKKEKRKRKGKEYEVTVHTLNKEERDNLSCKPRMLWQNKEQVYVAEMPLVYTGGSGVNGLLYYVFYELTLEEQEKYFDRSTTIPMTKESVVQVYGEESKRLFNPKKKTKKRTK